MENVGHHGADLDIAVPTTAQNPRILRRQLLQAAAALGLALALPSFSREAEAQATRKIMSSRMELMRDHNMPPGFSRYAIMASLGGEEEQLVGSFFSMEDAGSAKGDFITAQQHPELFNSHGRPHFSAIKQRHRNTALVVAGAYLAECRERSIEGIALERGTMVGESEPRKSHNGLLVIKGGIPEIAYLNQIPDLAEFLDQAKREGWSMFQQTSFIRPGGTFHSTESKRVELRFFVEGKGKKGIVNFSVGMTYDEALEVLKRMNNFEVEKAIGLDTGMVSEGYFYDADGQGYLMVDEIFGRGASYTNVLVLYSDK